MRAFTVQSVGVLYGGLTKHQRKNMIRIPPDSYGLRLGELRTSDIGCPFYLVRFVVNEAVVYARAAPSRVKFV